MNTALKKLGRAEAKVMRRADLTSRVVAQQNNGEAIVAGIGNTHFDLWAAGQRPQNFYMLGSMGLAIPIALGVAIAQPERKVIALEGDGSLLMQLGALGTVAHIAPKNLVMVVWDNGAYQITGGQPTLTSSKVDLVQMALGAGIERSFWAADEEHFESLLQDASSAGQPTFICARIGSEPPAGVTDRDANKIRTRFMEALNGVSRV